MASQQVVIPARPDYLSTLGIDYLISCIKKLEEEFNEYAALDAENIQTIHPKIMGVVFTMVKITDNAPIATHRQFIAQTQRSGVNVFRKHLRGSDSIYSTASQSLLPTILVAMKTLSSKTNREIVGEIKGFVDEFEQNLQS